MSRLRRWLPVVVWAGAILAMSSIPASELPAPLPFAHADKLIHAAEYAVAGALLAWALRGRAGRTGVWAAAAAGAALLGVTDELYQSLVPGRDSSALDWLADCAGASLGGFGGSRV